MNRYVPKIHIIPALYLICAVLLYCLFTLNYLLYLSAVLQVSDEPIEESTDPTNVLQSEGAYGYSSSYKTVSGKLIEPEPVKGCPVAPAVGTVRLKMK